MWPRRLLLALSMLALVVRLLLVLAGGGTVPT
jgi:hypothetical protein